MLQTRKGQRAGVAGVSRYGTSNTRTADGVAFVRFRLAAHVNVSLFNLHRLGEHLHRSGCVWCRGVVSSRRGKVTGLSKTVGDVLAPDHEGSGST